MMCLIHIQAVYAELFKGNDVILAGAVLKLFELRFQSALRALQRLDRKTFGPLLLQLAQTFLYLIDLFL